LGKQLQLIIDEKLDIDFEEVLPAYKVGTNEASRATGGNLIPKISEHIISFIGGSADLTKSTKAKGIGGNFSKGNPTGRNISFGVREHAMAAIVNGMTLHHLQAFSGGFFVFSDYMKPAMRMAAVMRIPSIYIFTHDSVAVGEDGPTHEPIEQLSVFRATPNTNLIRPGDANETRFAFRYALESKETPTVIALSRQNLEVKKESVSYDVFKQGAYVISDKENFEGILIATGSEVSLALDVQDALEKEGVNVRVVSMPSYDIFKDMPKEVQENVLPSKVTKRLAIELGATDMWYRFANNVFGIDRFGESGPGDEVIAHFGFTVENIVNVYKKIK
jgi:transketolase